jgi:hypothetical protein
VFITKKVRFNGHEAVDLPTLGVRVEPGDVIDVPDCFENALFTDVKESKKTAKESDSE